MLGGVRKLINAMGDDDQLMLYTTAGSTECVLPATSDKNLMYKTLGSIKQVEGSMDTARLISAVYSELQSDYQALAPRKAAMIVTDAGQVLTNMALFATLASDVSDQIGMAAYIYLMTDRPGAFETLESDAGHAAAGQRHQEQPDRLHGLPSGQAPGDEGRNAAPRQAAPDLQPAHQREREQTAAL